MGLSIEDLGDGSYAILRTEGRVTRTAYVAYSSKDADDLIEALEFCELMSRGVPQELVTAKRATTPHLDKQQRKPTLKKPKG